MRVARAAPPFFCGDIFLISLRKQCRNSSPLSPSLATEEDFLLSSGGEMFLFDLDAQLHCRLTDLCAQGLSASP